MQNLANTIFCAHGSPMNIIDNTDYSNNIKQLSKKINKPKAVVVVSAHLSKENFTISLCDKYKTIYDFYGFPHELYNIQYDALCDKDLAIKMSQELNIEAQNDNRLDHGAWAVLMKLFPNIDVPIVQISLNENASCYEHYMFGKRLQQYRSQDIMIVTSGNITHNLRHATFQTNTTYEWAQKVETDIANLIQTKNITALCDPYKNIENFYTANQTLEHYTPMLITLGTLFEDEEVILLESEMQNGCISMLGLAN